MNALRFSVFAILLAMASAGAIGLIGPGAHGVGLQGPGSHTAIVGPDGSHIAAATHGGGVAAPGLHGGIVSAAIAPGLVGIHGGHVGLIGSGLEGQYVPSGLESLHDDGSYRPEHHYGGHDYDDGHY